MTPRDHPRYLVRLPDGQVMRSEKLTEALACKRLHGGLVYEPLFAGDRQGVTEAERITSEREQA